MNKHSFKSVKKTTANWSQKKCGKQCFTLKCLNSECAQLKQDCQKYHQVPKPTVVLANCSSPGLSRVFLFLAKTQPNPPVGRERRVFLPFLLGLTGQLAWNTWCHFLWCTLQPAPLQKGGAFLAATCTWVYPELPEGVVLSQGRR